MSTSQKSYLILGAVLLAFFGLSGGLIYRAIQSSSDTFVTGLPPSDVKNLLLPNSVTLAAIRPPAIRPSDPVRYGNATSAAAVIVFGDYECGACKDLNTNLEKVVAGYHGTVRLVWRDLPVTDVNPNAMDAAVFARCAGLQGKFWDAHDALYAATALNTLTYNAISAALRLSDGPMQACRRDPAVQAAIQQDVDTARNDGINSAPFLFIGTQGSIGTKTTDELQNAIQTFLSS